MALSTERDDGEEIDDCRKSAASPSQLLAALTKTNTAVSSSLRRSIRRHIKNNEYDGGAGGDGLDFLRAKNGLMISYLIDLTMSLRCRLNDGNDDVDDDVGDGVAARQLKKQEEQQCMERLLEMKTALEKMRPLEKRMRYQIDKLLALSTLGAGTFAAVGREEEDAEENGNNKKNENGEDVGDNDYGDGQLTKNDDPLSFKPDLRGMMKMFENEDDEPKSNNENDSNLESDADDSDVESSKPKIALEKNYNERDNGGVYRPPRLQSAPFVPDDERKLARESRLLQKQRDRLSRSELADVVRSQLAGDAPEVEDVRGGAMLGKQSEASRRIAARDARIQEFEESQMMRLTMGKEERKARKKMMREEMSNLGAIAGGLGGVAAGVVEAFGGGEREEDDDNVGFRGSGKASGRLRDSDYGVGGSFKVKGMRKRRVEVLESGPSSGAGGRRMKKKKGSLNAHQKSLYGRDRATISKKKR